MKSFYITTPIYYVNAQPHIGHTYTTIAADVFARYYRQKLGEQNVFFLTGTDEHGAKVYEKAMAAGMQPQEFCDDVAQKFMNTWQKYNISNNKFIRTTDADHKAFVQDFITKLRDAEALYEAEYEGLYCVGCEKFMTSKELVDGQCPHHLKAPEVIHEKNWFFNLEAYLPKIKEAIESGDLAIYPESAKKEVLGLFKQGVPNFSVSREKEKVQWGIELPWDESQLIYVWCDALSNYLSAVHNEDWWPASMHLMAKDILKFHALYWPAMLLAAGYDMPERLFIHGFFTVDGQKMSKSLGNVIDPNEMVEEFGIDASRYLLLSQFPFGQDGDIDKKRFIEKYNADLANGLGNLVNRVVALVVKNYDGNVDASFKTDNKAADALLALLDDKQAEYQKNIEETYRLDRCLDGVHEIISECDKIISETELWKLVKEDAQAAQPYFYVLLEALRMVARQLAPFMPETAEKILAQIGAEAGSVTIEKKDVLFMRK